MMIINGYLRYLIIYLPRKKVQQILSVIKSNICNLSNQKKQNKKIIISFSQRFKFSLHI